MQIHHLMISMVKYSLHKICHLCLLLIIFLRSRVISFWTCVQHQVSFVSLSGVPRNVYECLKICGVKTTRLIGSWIAEVFFNIFSSEYFFLITQQVLFVISLVFCSALKMLDNNDLPKIVFFKMHEKDLLVDDLLGFYWRFLLQT